MSGVGSLQPVNDASSVTIMVRQSGRLGRLLRVNHSEEKGWDGAPPCTGPEYTNRRKRPAGRDRINVRGLRCLPEGSFLFLAVAAATACCQDLDGLAMATAPQVQIE